MISIIIATYNADQYLQRALNSISHQTSSEYEILISDGKSTDSTVDIIKRNSQHIKWWISQKDEGIYDAWNKALVHARGDWILFLGADDQLFDRYAIQLANTKLRDVPKQIEIAYGQVAHTDSQGKTWLLAGEDWAKFQYSFRKKSQMLPHQGVFHRNSIFLNQNKFNNYYKVAGDYDLLLRVLKKNEAKFIENLIVSKMQIGGVSSKFNSLNLHHDFMLARRINGYPETIWTMLLRLRYTVRSILIYLIGINNTKWINNMFRVILGKPKIPE
jgi:glycosyltransferase involved in cell wall biosynthesis